MRRPTVHEREFHAAVAQWLRLALRPPTTWTTFPAGGGGLERGRMLQRLGLRAGWPDIIVIHPAILGGCATVVGIELKAAAGKLSQAQKEMAAEFDAAGAVYACCRSLEEIERALRGALIPVHATVQVAA